MIRRVSSWACWIAVFLAWFWIDGDLYDPALFKDLLLPPALCLLLLASGGALPRTRWLFVPLAFAVWSLARIGGHASLPGEIMGTALAAFAFLLGGSGAVPPVGLALAALAIAVGKGWDDLLFLRNIGQGIPFTATSFFIHKNFFGLVLAPSLILGVSGFLKLPRWSSMWFLSAILLLAGVSLLGISDCRGALAGFCISMLLGVGVRWSSLWRTSRVRWIVPLLLALGIGTIALQSERMRQTRAEIHALLAGEPVTTRVSERFRPWVWRGAVELWEGAPCQGIGVGEFRYSIESVLEPWDDAFRNRDVRVDVAHSHWLQTLVERGLVGLTLEAFCVLVAMWFAWRSGRWALALAIACISIHGLVAEGLEYSMGSVAWWYLIGAGFATISSRGGANVRPIVLGAMAAFLLPTWYMAREVYVEQRMHESRTGRLLRDSELEELWKMSPRSAQVLIEIARRQVGRSRIIDALGTMDHLRELYPEPGAVGMDLAYSGLLRATGHLDSAEAVTREMLSLYPNDAWFIHEWLRIARERGGCERVRVERVSYLKRMEGILRVPDRGSEWTSWRHRLVLDSTRARGMNERLRTLTLAPWEPARREWQDALAMCADKP